MFDVRHLRPVSGEIMTDGCVRSSVMALANDIEDAEILYPSTVVPSSSDRLGPRVRGGGIEPRVGMDMLKNYSGHRAASERGGPMFWIAGIVLALACFWVSGGHALWGTALVRLATSATEEPMRIAQLTSRVQGEDGRRLLVIDGSVENTASEAGNMPRLAIEVTGDGGRITRYTLDAAGTVVEPGERYHFSSRVNAPMGTVEGISVKMTKRDD